MALLRTSGQLYIGLNGQPSASAPLCRARSAKLRFIFILIFVLFCGSIGVAKAPGEYEIKAVYIYNFAKFVEWPARAFEDAGSPFVIGIIGDDPFGKIMEDTFDDKTVNGRKFTIKRYKRVRDIKACHIIFVSLSEERNIQSIIEAIRNEPTLSVGDSERFIDKGGIISFIVEDKKVRFNVNVCAARQAGLKISSKLLKLAKEVKEN